MSWLRRMLGRRGPVRSDSWSIFHPQVANKGLQPRDRLGVIKSPSLTFIQAHVHPSKLQIQALRWGTALALSAAVYQFATNLQVVPITGRTQVVALSQEEEWELGRRHAGAEVATSKLITEGPALRLCVDVSARLVSVSEHLFPRKFDWHVWLIDAPDKVNAGCYPGGKIVIYSGILDVIDWAVEKGYCKSKHDALAVILSHEIGHALARHTAEQMSYLPITYLQYVLDTDSPLFNFLFELVFNLPFSRKHEHEADHIGIMLMSSACYDPAEAPGLWAAFAAFDEDDDKFTDFVLEFLSTHPTSKKRHLVLKELVQEALELQQRSSWCVALKETVRQQLSKQSGVVDFLERVLAFQRSQDQNQDQRVIRRKGSIGTVHEMENEEIYRRIKLEQQQRSEQQGGTDAEQPAPALQ